MNSLSLKNRELYIYLAIIMWFIVKIQFYRYVGFPQAVVYSNFATIFAGFVYILCFDDILNIKEHKCISFIAIGVLFSYLISIIYWGASPFKALQAQAKDVGLLYVIVFFCFRRWGVEKTTAQYILMTLAFIYLLCWGYALYKMPELVFGIDRDGEYGEITKRGFYRTFIPGNVSAILTFFFLCSFLNKRQPIYVVLTICMYVIVILHVGRQAIMWTFISSALMVFTYYKKHFIYIVAAAIIGYFCIEKISEQIPAVSAMIEMTEEQGENYQTDIRVEASKYFLFEYPHNPITVIFGNGVPATETELYSISQKEVMRGYYQTDVGFIAMFCNYGLFGVVCFLFLLWRIVKLKVEPEYIYLKYYIYYVFGTYLMSQALTSAMFVVMIAYYVLEKSAKDLQTD